MIDLEYLRAMGCEIKMLSPWRAADIKFDYNLVDDDCERGSEEG